MEQSRLFWVLFWGPGIQVGSQRAAMGSVEGTFLENRAFQSIWAPGLARCVVRCWEWCHLLVTFSLLWADTGCGRGKEQEGLGREREVHSLARSPVTDYTMPDV